MANIFPFQPFRYTAKAGALQDLVTQPYDKISPEMRQRYLQASPYNLVRIILGERHESDSGSDNVYTRAARQFKPENRFSLFRITPYDGFSRLNVPESSS